MSKFDKLITQISKNELQNYYFDHNIHDTAKYFNISIDMVTKLCRYYNIKKSIELINKQIKQTKIQNKTNDCINKRLDTIINKYGSYENFIKQKTLKTKLTNSQKENSFNNLLKQINPEEFYNLYIVENNPRQYIKEKYNLTDYKLDKLINYYNFNKSRKQSKILALNTKYKLYGSKAEYDKYIQEKSHNTKINKYGSMQGYRIYLSNKCRNAWAKKTPEQINQFINKINTTCKERYNVDFACQRKEARLKGNNSKPNQLFAQLLDDNNISYEREFPLENKSYDFKIGNILIEINPSITHNSTYGIYNNPPLDKFYHKTKTELANTYNYRCIHIWDWDDINKIINLLQSKQKIYARKCLLKEISKKDLDKFLIDNHLQNTCNNQNIRLALFYNNEIVQVMTFGKPRYNNNYEYELLRLCTKNDYVIIGGSEKLFSYFLKNYKPNSIISYCDKSKFSGDIYQKLGFKYERNSISKHWYNIKLNIHILDSSLRAKGFDKLLGNKFGKFGKGTSNTELMLNNGFVEIYDSGQSTYIYIK